MKKSTKKKLLISGIILAVLLVVVIVVLYIIGFDNIKAVYYGVKYDKEEIRTMLDDGDRRLKEKISSYDNITAREPTEEEMQSLASGKITTEELAKIIVSGISLDEYLSNDYWKNNDSEDENTNEEDNPGGLEKPNEQTDEAEEGIEVSGEQPAGDRSSGKDSTKGSPADGVDNNTGDSSGESSAGTPEQSAQSSQAECDEKVSQIVAKMYILRSSYTGSLSGLASQAYADYQAGVPKATIVSNYMSQGYGLEAQCDANVNALMSELTGILNQYGQSTELVNTIYSAYESEKQYTKAYYMSLYLNN